MVISVLLLAVLFVAGFINIFFYFPTKKVYVKIQSFFSTTPNSTAVAAPKPPSTSSTTTAQVSSHRGRSISTNSSNKTVELKRVFATFDKNGDGFITKQELRESLKNLRLMVTEKETEEMVVKVDANGDGLIDFDEFRSLYKAMIAQDYDDGDDDRSVDGGEEVGDGGEEDLKDAFDVFDKDKDGLISVEELGLVLSSLGLNEGKKIENCREMIRKVDMDGDGMVNFDEFKKMMKSGGKLLTAS